MKPITEDRDFVEVGAYLKSKLARQGNWGTVLNTSFACVTVKNTEWQ